MHIIGLSLLVQLLCVVHCLKSGARCQWICVIAIFSIPGCLIYAWFNIIPELAGRRAVRFAAAEAARKLDPTRALRQAREALEVADTAANRTALADALADAQQWREASAEYRIARSMAPEGDRALAVKLAQALLEAGDAAAARDLLSPLPETFSTAENDRVKLLLARTHEACGQPEQAISRYRDLAERVPGGEAHCRLAALLIAQGRNKEAVPVLQDVERLVKRLDRVQRAQSRDMYDWAASTLSNLRQAG